jgi:hypothetical protein
MAQWKKVITSGSIAELNVISASAHYVQENQQLSPLTIRLNTLL